MKKNRKSSRSGICRCGFFHWLLVLGVLGAYVTADYGGSLIDWHGRFGGLLMGLLVFRVIWGFTGTPHARFASFVPTPARIVSYLNGDWHGQGHTPIGGLAVLALLSILLFLAFTGLFANDDIAFQGQWFHLVDKSLSDSISGWHAKAFDILTVLILLHLAAIGFYLLFKKRNLVKPMLTGKKTVPKASLTPNPDSHPNTSTSRFLIALVISVVLAWGIYSGIPEYLFNSHVSSPAVTAGW
jgi:cytochrome b